MNADDEYNSGLGVELARRLLCCERSLIVTLTKTMKKGEAPEFKIREMTSEDRHATMSSYAKCAVHLFMWYT